VAGQTVRPDDNATVLLGQVFIDARDEAIVYLDNTESLQKSLWLLSVSIYTPHTFIHIMLK
jgi:hypothetical protein